MPAQQVPGVPIKGKPNLAQPQKATSRLGALLNERANLLAQKVEVSTMEQMAAEAELETKRLHEQLNGVSSNGHNKDAGDSEEAKKQNLMTHAIMLLNSGVDPKIVGFMLTGMSPSPFFPQAPAKNGDTSDTLKLVKDIIGIFKESGKLDGNRESPMIEKLKDDNQRTREDLKELKMLFLQGAKTKPEDPLTAAATAAKQVVALYSSFREVGLMPQGDTQKSLEVVKEENRHAEKIEEIKANKEGKNETAKMIGGAINNIGRAAARALVTESAGEQTDDSVVVAKSSPQPATVNVNMTPGDGSTTVPFPCPCGEVILVSPEAREITCPKCKRVFGKE